MTPRPKLETLGEIGTRTSLRALARVSRPGPVRQDRDLRFTRFRVFGIDVGSAILQKRKDEPIKDREH